MKAMHLVIVVTLSVVTVVAGVYAVAATSAATLAASFSTEQTTSRSRMVEFASKVKQAAAEHRAAHAKCRLLAAGDKKEACNAAVRAEDGRAFSAHQF